ncbi:MAG: hypothetical protein HQL58_04985 [Magnetococcales bacterium]|nr:hypothetical protein [Magnetococcales bacterium]
MDRIRHRLLILIGCLLLLWTGNGYSSDHASADLLSQSIQITENDLKAQGRVTLHSLSPLRLTLQFQELSGTPERIQRLLSLWIRQSLQGAWPDVVGLIRMSDLLLHLAGEEGELTIKKISIPDDKGEAATVHANWQRQDQGYQWQAEAARLSLESALLWQQRRSVPVVQQLLEQLKQQTGGRLEQLQGQMVWQRPAFSGHLQGQQLTRLDGLTTITAAQLHSDWQVERLISPWFKGARAGQKLSAEISDVRLPVRCEGLSCGIRQGSFNWKQRATRIKADRIEMKGSLHTMTHPVHATAHITVE